ncbi:hypothetical protein JOD45_001315 [Scopulibacillus daqui]|uniref:MazG-like nucleotide pyrophosphohydrolase family protein n=1 Tax=Scopulibacillus daqui TaxID=1469162 RepID=A0ABS2PYI5_9BACL|nr:hypothetical protein [Scopulibacillus daqui]MBM7645104.1 hypothetical protein [Scopulibacillus daqui]
MNFHEPLNELDEIKEDHKSTNQALVTKSGNSDVDVTVIVDTTAIAYAMACMMNANGTLNEDEFNHMLGKLNRLLGKNRSTHDEEDDAHHHSRASKPWIRPVRTF